MMSNKKISKKIIRFKFQRNDLFKKEVYYFINALKKKKPIDPKYGLAKSIRALELTLKLKK